MNLELEPVLQNRLHHRALHHPDARLTVRFGVNCEPFRMDPIRAALDGDHFFGSQLAITNLTGNPVVCMPTGFNNNGSPVSITLIGKLYDEATILAAAKAYQDKTDFNKQHPAKFRQ